MNGPVEPFEDPLQRAERGVTALSPRRVGQGGATVPREIHRDGAQPRRVRPQPVEASGVPGEAVEQQRVLRALAPLPD